jgi:FtsP/CotA-like multicopper oxidase with cupredoxin domain
MPSGIAGQPLRDLSRATDTNPDPHVVEISLTAAPATCEFVPGQPTVVWAYNGSVPGPLIECNQGDELIVHFSNHLPEETTVHWHGIRLPSGMDGSHLSQTPVPPGGTFTYRFTVPDASLFWYHPHHDGQQQLYRGLYGALLVRGANEPELTRERVMVLSDIGLNSAGQLIDPALLSDTQLERALGVEGNTLLVNGQISPRLTTAPGGTERWRVVNAATARYFNLGVPGQPLRLLGTDGGAVEAPVTLDHLVLAPGERADLAVSAPPRSGVASQLMNLSFQRLHLGGYPATPAAPLAALESRGPQAAAVQLPAALASIPQLSSDLPERRFGLNAAFRPQLDAYDPGHAHSGLADRLSGMEHPAADGEAESVTFLINLHSYPDIPRFTCKRGTTEIWRIQNHTGMDHPFHLHGFRFQVLDVDGIPPPYRSWKDTVNVDMLHEGGDGVVRLLVQFDGYPGDWVYHCHILFHQEHGMMGEFTVEE